MNDFLILNALSVLKFAPLFLLFNGYWMVDNRQIFDNTYSYINYYMESMKSSHTLDNCMDVGRHAPILAVICASVFILVAQIFFQNYL